MKLFDRKISDTTTSGFDSQEVADWLDKVEKIDEFKYYYFTRGAKRARSIAATSMLAIMLRRPVLFKMSLTSA